MRPHLGKMRLTWAIYAKSGQKSSRIGQKKFNRVLLRTGLRANTFVYWIQPRLTRDQIDELNAELRELADRLAFHLPRPRHRSVAHLELKLHASVRRHAGWGPA